MFKARIFVLFLGLIVINVACTTENVAAGNAVGASIPGPAFDATKAPQSGQQTAVVAGDASGAFRLYFSTSKA